MAALVGLGPLADPSALWGIAQQLWAARDRLALRTGASIPSPSQLLVALRMYMRDQDRRRAAARARADEMRALRAAAAEQPVAPEPLREQPASPREQRASPQEQPPDLDLALAGRLLMLAEAAYADHEEDLRRMLGMVTQDGGGGGELLLEARYLSSRCHPAYFIAYDAALEAVVLSVRGSKEIADFITNLSCETAPFHTGYGHSGVVQSAQNLAAVVAPTLPKYLDAHRPRNGLVIVGHSLGAAVATLLAIIIRTGTLEAHVTLAKPPPQRLTSVRPAPPPFSSTLAAEIADAWHSPTGAVSAIAEMTRCYAFSPPPCVSPDVASQAKALGVVSIILGLDMVPRLSAGSLDALLLELSRYDWRSEMTGNVEVGLRGFLSQALGPASGAAAAAAVASIGPNLIGPVVGAIQRSAQTALMAPRQAPIGPGQPPPPGMHPAQKMLLGAVAVGGGFLMHQFFQPENPRAARSGSGPGRVGGLGRAADGGDGNSHREQYSFASRFGMSAAQVEEVLLPNQPEILHLAGRLLHLDRPFTSPDEYRDDESLPPAQIVEREPGFFSKVEASSWMLHDHHPPNISVALATVQR